MEDKSGCEVLFVLCSINTHTYLYKYAENIWILLRMYVYISKYCFSYLLLPILSSFSESFFFPIKADWNLFCLELTKMGQIYALSYPQNA